MQPWLSFAVASLALIVSGLTAWFTFFRRGMLAMTQPTCIFFGPDGPRFDGRSKVYLRTLLYSTAKRGQVIESLHIALQRSESKQNFSVWVYGHKDALQRGSGLFVPQEGVTFDHHFLLPPDSANYSFQSGTYRLTVFATFVGARTSKELISIPLTVSDSHANALSKPNTGVHFDWGPDAQSYHVHTENRTAGDPNIKPITDFLTQLQKKG